MRILLIIIGSLAGLYAAFGIVQMVSAFVQGDPGSAYSVSNMAASVVPVAIGLVVCLVCFQQAFSKPKSDGKSESEHDSK